jgi:hypothetical protein
MQHLQGDLQTVFDALYEMGVIEPVLNMDWKPILTEMESGKANHTLVRVLHIANSCGKNRSVLMSELGRLEKRELEILAMEVAREYAGYHTREQLH